MPRKDSWTPEMDADIVRLRQIEEWKWSAIAVAVGRSSSASHRRYMQITDPDIRVKLYRRTWTSAQETELYRLRYDDKFSPREIAVIIKRTAPSIEAKLERMRNGPRRKVHFERHYRHEVPQSCIDDRDRRASADRTITEMLCGDPAPGQSALDRRMVLA